MKKNQKLEKLSGCIDKDKAAIVFGLDIGTDKLVAKNSAATNWKLCDDFIANFWAGGLAKYNFLNEFVPIEGDEMRVPKKYITDAEKNKKDYDEFIALGKPGKEDDAAKENLAARKKKYKQGPDLTLCFWNTENTSNSKTLVQRIEEVCGKKKDSHDKNLPAAYFLVIMGTGENRKCIVLGIRRDVSETDKVYPFEFFDPTAGLILHKYYTDYKSFIDKAAKEVYADDMKSFIIDCFEYQPHEETENENSSANEVVKTEARGRANTEVKKLAKEDEVARKRSKTVSK